MAGDRYERRKVTEVESGVNHTYGRAGSFPLAKARAMAMGWKDRYVMQGCATPGDRLWRYTGNAVVLDLLADECPHDDSPERRLLLADLLALIEERHDTGRSDHLDHGLRGEDLSAW
jgi:hypothetical protein